MQRRVAMAAGLALGAALALPESAPALGVIGAVVPAPATDKAVPVSLGPWRFWSGAPPANWADPAFDDRAWGGPAAGPFAPRRPILPDAPAPASGGVGTLFDPAPGQPLLMRARFAVSDPTEVRVLDLRVAYADGFVAFVNGREVARRNVAPGAAVALGFHGPEIERVSVPLPSRTLPSLQRDGNLLAIAVYGAPGRNPAFATAPAALAELGAARGVRILRGPYLSAPSDGPGGAGVRVSWQTDRPATAIVTVAEADGPDGGEPRRIAVEQSALTQTVRLDGLKRGAAYTYRVEVDAGAGATWGAGATSDDRAAAGPFRFQTLPAAPAPLRFAVYGDMRYPGHDAHRAIVEGLVREAPPVVFNTGDLTDVGSEESNWQRYFAITAPMGAIAPVVPALGNHDADRRGAGAALAWSLFGVPAAGPPGWTSLDLGGVHFVILSTNEMANPAQRDWLRDDLARARRHHARAIFAFCHEGPWAHGVHGGSHQMVRDYAPLLAAAHVDVLFSGHDHIYERGVGTTPQGPLTYVVSGGGGAPLYNPSCQAASGPPPVVPGPLPPCPSSVATLTNAYHYIMVEVAPSGITLCPRRPDGTPLEACVHLPPHPGHRSHAGN